MALEEEFLKPFTEKMGRPAWGLAGLVVGFFMGFVDTLFIAALLGHFGVQVSAYFGVPTTFTGYFCAGLIVGRSAPPRISWEPCVGILACVLLLMWGVVGLHGHGPAVFLFHFALVPALAVVISYAGMKLGRGEFRAWVLRRSGPGGRSDAA